MTSVHPVQVQGVNTRMAGLEGRLGRQNCINCMMNSPGMHAGATYDIYTSDTPQAITLAAGSMSPRATADDLTAGRPRTSNEEVQAITTKIKARQEVHLAGK